MPASSEPTIELPPTTVVHRIGGGQMENLGLRPLERNLQPPGISVLLGGLPTAAARQMRSAYPDRRKFDRLHRLAEVVGTTTVEAIRAAGFSIIADPSERFPNHARIIHPDGSAGFSEENLRRLSVVFQNTATAEK